MTNNVMSARLLQLYALKAQVDALIVAEEGEIGIGPDPNACPSCGADEEHIVKADTMDGTKRRHCGACQSDWTMQ